MDAKTSMGTLTYQWESSVNGAAWSTITSATNVDYDPPSLSKPHGLEEL